MAFWLVKSMQMAFCSGRWRPARNLVKSNKLGAAGDEPSPLYEQITIRGTERLLEQLKGLHVEQFIFSSTMLVHGPTDPGQRINEGSAIDPRWPYPQSKVETEALIHNEHGEIPIALLRLAGVYDDRGHSAFLSQQIARLDEEPFFKPWMVDFADAHYELDISRARRLLAWEPKHSLRESLPKITAALKSDPVGWYRANKLDAARVAADRVSTSGADEGMAPLDHKKMMREHAEEMRQCTSG
jgi:nucleoside-diphosphate-sugar epimerase